MLVNEPTKLHLDRNVEDQIIWNIADPSILDLDEENLEITGKKPGITKLTAMMNGISSTLSVTVYSIDVNSKLSIRVEDYQSAGLEIGEETSDPGCGIDRTGRSKRQGNADKQ